MSSVNQTLNQVSALLRSLPGVSVERQGINATSATFEVTTSSANSAHTLQTICEAANAALEPPLLLRDPDFNSETTRTFALSVSLEPFENIRHGTLQLLGIHLVWHLHTVGALPQDAANELLHYWHGHRVGA